MRLYLIRHGRTDWNDERKIMGVGPVPLNDEGRSTVRRLAETLSADGIPVIYTSTVVRAMETAEILAAEWGSRIIEEPRLNESPYERWVGKRYSELSQDPDFQLYSSKPSASRFSLKEGMHEVQARALSAVERIVGETDGGRAAAVSHSDVIKPLVAHLLGMDIDSMHRISIANASATLVVPDAEKNRIRYLNYAPWKRWA
jgi:broad specificity phosphatase PhoE